MKEDNIELSLIIPFYNDEGCVKPFVEGLVGEFERSRISYELILVDDCSTDETPKRMDEVSTDRVRILHNKWNKDYGGAIMEGFHYAKGDIIGFTCGDGEVTPKDIVEVYKKREGRDVVKSIREGRKDGLLRNFLSRSFNLFTSFRFGLNLIDVNGYPVFMKRDIYYSLPPLRSDWLFNLDLYRKIAGRKSGIHELPVKHRKRMSGKSHMDPVRIIKMIAKYITYR
ncbi:glycosyltransferase family 2 protein [Candidatus Woesearchaeota archaeon]|nr:glycosyltransferase family 2 protein [Candidatus Woesearchaeota archaeon]